QRIVATRAAARHEPPDYRVRRRERIDVIHHVRAQSIGREHEEIAARDRRGSWFRARQVVADDATEEHQPRARARLLKAADHDRPAHRARRARRREHHVRLHLVIVIVVPAPGAEVISNASIRRLAPGRPRPRPPPVEYPSFIAAPRSAMPGPRSLAMTRT